MTGVFSLSVVAGWSYIWEFWFRAVPILTVWSSESGIKLLVWYNIFTL